jgi:histone deacetylase HOS3
MIAAKELSKLLIPRDRQTESATFEELNPGATHVRRERALSGASDLDRPTSRMSLRERKPRAIDPIQEQEETRQMKDRKKPAAVSTIAAEKVKIHLFFWA